MVVEAKGVVWVAAREVLETVAVEMAWVGKGRAVAVATVQVMAAVAKEVQLGDRGEVRESAQPAGECARGSPGGSRARHTLHHRGGTLPACALSATSRRLTAYARARHAADCMQRYNGASDTARNTAREAAARWSALHACRTRAREAQLAPCLVHPPASASRDAAKPVIALAASTTRSRVPRKVACSRVAVSRRLQPHRADRHRLRRQHLAQPPSVALHKNCGPDGALGKLEPSVRLEKTTTGIKYICPRTARLMPWPSACLSHHVVLMSWLGWG